MNIDVENVAGISLRMVCASAEPRQYKKRFVTKVSSHVQLLCVCVWLFICVVSYKTKKETVGGMYVCKYAILQCGVCI